MIKQPNESHDSLKNNKIDKLSSTSPIVTSQLASTISSQVKPVKPYKPRRTYDAAYKARILVAFDACQNAAERSAFLRREGLYYSRICAWKHESSNKKLNNKSNKKQLRTDHLISESAQLKKKLAQAEAIIDLQKKVSELFG